MIRLKPGNSHICKQQSIKESNTVIWIFPVLSDNLAVLNFNDGSLIEGSH